VNPCLLLLNGFFEAFDVPLKGLVAVGEPLVLRTKTIVDVRGCVDPVGEPIEEVPSGRRDGGSGAVLVVGLVKPELQSNLIEGPFQS
jgi:hypothetical protein